VNPEGPDSFSPRDKIKVQHFWLPMVAVSHEYPDDKYLIDPIDGLSRRLVKIRVQGNP
jgi:hypothetical protein